MRSISSSGSGSAQESSRSAAQAQIRIAVLAHVLVAVLKKRIDVGRSLCTILQILSVSAFGKKKLYQLPAGHDCRRSLPVHP